MFSHGTPGRGQNSEKDFSKKMSKGNSRTGGLTRKIWRVLLRETHLRKSLSVYLGHDRHQRNPAGIENQLMERVEGQLCQERGAKIGIKACAGLLYAAWGSDVAGSLGWQDSQAAAQRHLQRA